MIIGPSAGRFYLRGASDNTLIGNVGDAIKVIGSISTLPLTKLVHIDRRFLNGSNADMSVNGSGTPQDFVFGPPVGQTWFVENLQILILDEGVTEPDRFGAIRGGLSNGFQIIQEIDGTEYELGNFRDNASLSLCFAQSPLINPNNNGWFDSRDFFMGVKEFNNEITLNGDNGDKLIARVRDNLSGLNNLYMVARAFRVI